MNFHTNEIVHVSDLSLRVKNLHVMKEFYTKIMGFHILEEDEKKLVLSANLKTPLLTLIQIEDATLIQRKAGLYHVAYLMPSRNDLANIALYLYQNNVALGAGDHHVSEALYLSDPEGNGIEIYADRDPKGWKWTGDDVYMTTEEVDFANLLEDRTESFQSIPKETVIGHVHLQVSNIEANLRFYQEGLGLSVVSKFTKQAYFLSDAKYHHHVAFNTWLGSNIAPAKESIAGLQSISIHIPNASQKEDILKRLDTLGFEVNFEKSYALDPSGTQINLTL